MGGSYSEDVAEFLIFGPNTSGVVTASEKAREMCNKKGLDIDGPIPLPRVTIDEDDEAFSEEGDSAVLFGQPTNDEERQVLPGTNVARRLLRIYSNDSVVRDVATIQLPDRVFMRMVLDKRTHGKGGKGTPHTYDPRLDYKTEP